MSLPSVKQLLYPSSSFSPRIGPTLSHHVYPSSTFSTPGLIGALLVAILLNHVRRILFPWMFQFLVFDAFDQMKLARASCYYFLEAATSWSWMELVSWWALDLGLWLGSSFVIKYGKTVTLSGEKATGKRNGKAASGTISKSQASRCQNITSGATDTFEFFLILSRLERAFTETCWISSNIYAMVILLFSKSHGYSAMFSMLFISYKQEKFLVNAIFVALWVYSTLRPVISETVPQMLRGDLSLAMFFGVVWAGTVYLVRYSNKYFMVLQMGDMLITFAWMAAGVVVVAIRIWNQRRQGTLNAKL